MDLSKPFPRQATAISTKLREMRENRKSQPFVLLLLASHCLADPPHIPAGCERVEQYALSATADEEYSHAYTAGHATGPPTYEGSCIRNQGGAWAPKEMSTDAHQITLTYARAVVPLEVRMGQSCPFRRCQSVQILVPTTQRARSLQTTCMHMPL